MAHSLSYKENQSSDIAADRFNSEIGKKSSSETFGGESHIQEAFQEMFQKSQEKLHEVEKQVEGYVRKHTTGVLLTAVGVGFLLGWLKRK